MISGELRLFHHLSSSMLDSNLILFNPALLNFQESRIIFFEGENRALLFAPFALITIVQKTIPQRRFP